jgi:hypothetical protein
MSKAFVNDILTLEENLFIEKYQGMTYLEFRENMRTALLEQDRDTRHAVTNAISTENCISDTNELNRTCSIVMNCIEGVK